MEKNTDILVHSQALVLVYFKFVLKTDKFCVLEINHCMRRNISNVVRIVSSMEKTTCQPMVMTNKQKLSTWLFQIVVMN